MGATLEENNNLIPRHSTTQNLRNIVTSREGILFIITIVAMMILSTQNENFLTKKNLLNQIRLLTEVGLVALPMTYIIITGGIDLSVGSIFGLSAIMLGYSWQEWGLPLPVAIFIAVFVGGVAGFVNGWFIVRIKVPALIMTLATLAFYRGLAEGISRGRSARGYPEWFYQMGQDDFLGIPTQIWLLVIFTIFAAIMLSRTIFGRALYAIGNNEIGARFSGLSVDRYLLAIYTFSGVMSGIAGYIFVSRVSTTRSDMGSGLELDVIAAVVLGGTSILGGSGSIPGTIIGVILIQLLKNGLALSGVTSDATIVVVGLVLIFSILVNNFIQDRKLS
jgi:rhamnose transport system permease protein